MGLPVPQNQPTNPANRYLFLLASAQFEAGQVARLVGMRQYLTIGQGVAGAGADAATYPIERPVVTPSWRFPDGNVSWLLRRYDIRPNSNANEFNRSGQSYLMSGTPSLLYVNSPQQIGGYSPPTPPGNVVMPDLGNFHDIRFPWADDHAWDSLDIEIKGPCTIGFFASILQTNPATRPTLNLTQPPPGGYECIPPEEAFILNFTGSAYTRVAGALIFEQQAMLEDYSIEQPWGVIDPMCEDPSHMPWHARPLEPAVPVRSTDHSKPRKADS